MPHSIEIPTESEAIVLETGELARQAHGAVLLRQGGTALLATVVADRGRAADLEFVPLTVEFREKASASGRIPGGAQRRDARLGEGEVRASRLIDRSLRPLFPSTWRHETLVQVAALSIDPDHEDVLPLGVLAASAALHLSPVPWGGPVAGLRVVLHADGVSEATRVPDARKVAADLMITQGQGGLVMLEGGSREVSEADLIKALTLAGDLAAPRLAAIEAWRAEVGAEKWSVDSAPSASDAAEAALAEPLDALLRETDRPQRKAGLAALAEHAAWEGLDVAPKARRAWIETAFKTRARARILAEQRRTDGRELDAVRPIQARVDWLSAPHGSALFTRGETQAAVTVTLDNPRSAIFDERGERQPFFLHYNFPSYSVGEARPPRGPSRREIGHGALAQRALMPLMPDAQRFGYAVRVESDILESNGSSSMATVCGASLALMAAGVPIEKPVAGVAMGLVVDGDKTAILTDISGEEDQYGDMDFKVAGTADGITAIQMDNKLGALDADMLAQALDRARAARLHILSEMAKTLAAPRAELADGTPRTVMIQVAPEVLGRVIGAKGATIKGIQSDCKVDINVEDDGRITISSKSAKGTRAAILRIREIVGVVGVGDLYLGKVREASAQGARLQLLDQAEGWLAAADWAEGFEGDLSTEVQADQEVFVRVMGVDKRGRIRLSRRAVADEDPATALNAP